MAKKFKRKRSQKQWTDQEVLEWLTQRVNYTYFTFVWDLSPHQARRDFWKRTLIAIFIGGPFLALAPAITWFGLISIWHLIIPLMANALILILFASSFHVVSKNEESSPFEQQNQQAYNIWFLGFIGWLVFFGSLMMLLSSIGFWVRVPGAPWWMLPVGYIIAAGGLWTGRRKILRALVEGADAHPWLRLLLIFGIPGFPIFVAAVLRIFTNRLEQYNPYLAVLVAAVPGLLLSLFFLGSAMVCGIIAYAHYQKWREGKKRTI